MQKVFVNRTLNLKRIRYIGFDMDHTLVRYKSEAFEALSFQIIKEKLVRGKGYPEKVLALPFDFDLCIRGLVIDRSRGNLLKVNRHAAIRAAFHGLKPLDFKTQNKTYSSTYIDLSDSNYMAIDTTFSISLAVIYSQLVEMKATDESVKLPDYAILADDVLDALDEAHRDGSIKEVVKQDLEKYIIKDPEVVAGLEKYKLHGKKVFIATNSDYHYMKLLLDFAIDPFLKSHSSWLELFEFAICSAQKPRYFYDNLRYLRVNPADGTMTNVDEKLTPGVYQGGDARKFTKDLNLQADEILYIGDHIYGDIVRLKKDCGWRTAMVIEELSDEVASHLKAAPINSEIDVRMREKEPLENELTELMTLKIENKKAVDEKTIDDLQEKILAIDSEISHLIREQQKLFNKQWGQLMRAGNEESYFAHQVDRYACIYMAKIADLLALSPRSYFRAARRPLAHEINS